MARRNSCSSGLAATPVADTSFNPAAPGATLRGGAGQPPAIVRLADGAGGINPAVTVNRKRQLVLREVMGPGGPLEVLVNNTKFGGLQDGTGTPIPGSSRVGVNWLTELPQIGSTEEWEIINLTADAHPIHPHMIQFQLVNRQVLRRRRLYRGVRCRLSRGVRLSTAMARR